MRAIYNWWYETPTPAVSPPPSPRKLAQTKGGAEPVETDGSPEATTSTSSSSSDAPSGGIFGASATNLFNRVQKATGYRAAPPSISESHQPPPSLRERAIRPLAWFGDLVSTEFGFSGGLTQFIQELSNWLHYFGDKLQTAFPLRARPANQSAASPSSLMLPVRTCLRPPLRSGADRAAVQRIMETAQRVLFGERTTFSEDDRRVLDQVQTLIHMSIDLATRQGLLKRILEDRQLTKGYLDLLLPAMERIGRKVDKQFSIDMSKALMERLKSTYPFAAIRKTEETLTRTPGNLEQRQQDALRRLSQGSNGSVHPVVRQNRTGTAADLEQLMERHLEQLCYQVICASCVNAGGDALALRLSSTPREDLVLRSVAKTLAIQVTGSVKRIFNDERIGAKLHGFIQKLYGRESAKSRTPTPTYSNGKGKQEGPASPSISGSPRGANGEGVSTSTPTPVGGVSQKTGKTNFLDKAVEDGVVNTLMPRLVTDVLGLKSESWKGDILRRFTSGYQENVKHKLNDYFSGFFTEEGEVFRIRSDKLLESLGGLEAKLLKQPRSVEETTEDLVPTAPVQTWTEWGIEWVCEGGLGLTAAAKKTQGWLKDYPHLFVNIVLFAIDDVCQGLFELEEQALVDRLENPPIGRGAHRQSCQDLLQLLRIADERKEVREALNLAEYQCIDPKLTSRLRRNLIVSKASLGGCLVGWQQERVAVPELVKRAHEWVLIEEALITRSVRERKAQHAAIRLQGDVTDHFRKAQSVAKAQEALRLMVRPDVERKAQKGDRAHS